MERSTFSTLHALRRRLTPAIPWVLLAIAGVLVPGSLSSCGRDEQIEPPVGWVAAEGVPTIRVRLTDGGVPHATISADGAHRIRVDGRTVHESAAPLPAATVQRTGGVWRVNNLREPGDTLYVEPRGRTNFRFDEVTYRGRLRLVPVGPDAFAVVNDVDIENYLAGVLPRELYPNWADATYAALAVAARTFALHHMRTTGRSQPWDVTDGQSSQVYGGRSAETDRSRRAVNRTRGWVLVYNAGGRQQMFMPQYSSTCGGMTNPASVIRDAPNIPPLAGGKTCEDCAASSKYRWPPVRIPKSDIAAAVKHAYPRAAAPMDGVRSVEVASRTSYGRAIWVDLTAPNGESIRIRAEDLRLAMLWADVPAAKRLYSMNCRLRDVGSAIEFYDGRGFGHGVGLCQYGAQQKAVQGWTARQILEFYYPGSEIVRLY